MDLQSQTFSVYWQQLYIFQENKRQMLLLQARDVNGVKQPDRTDLLVLQIPRALCNRSWPETKLRLAVILLSLQDSKKSVASHLCLLQM